MKNKILLLLFCFAKSSCLFSQNGFDLYLTAPAGCSYHNITATSDHGFILCGTSTNTVDSTTDFYIEKHDSIGQYQWSKSITNTPNYLESAQGIIQTYDGNYIFIGSGRDPLDYYEQYCYVSKVDSTGSTIWYFANSGGVFANGGDIISTPDSGYILRYHEYYGAGSHTEKLSCYSKTDSLIYNSFAGFDPFGDRNYGVNKNSNLITFASSCDYCYNFDFFHQPIVRRISPTGNQDWEFVFSRERNSTILPTMQSICPTDSNGAMICGYDTNTVGTKNISLIYVSPIGDSTWTKTYPHTYSELPDDIQLCADSGYIITGTVYDGCVNGNIFLFKLNQNTDSVWFKTYDGLVTNHGYSVTPTNEGGYIIFGYSADYTNSYYRIIKTDANGNINSINPYTISANLPCSFYCPDDTALLTVNPSASSFLWSTGDTTQTIFATTTHTYTVTVTDSIGQTFTSAPFGVYFYPSPLANLGADTINACGIYTLNSLASTGAGFSYQWFRNDTLLTTETNDSILATSTGEYKLIVTNQCGTTTDSTNIFINPQPILSLGNDTLVCNTQTILLDAGNGFINYQWQDSSNTQTYLATDSTGIVTDTLFYFVTVTDANGCKATDTLQIIFDICAGINSITENNFTIQPNPSNGKVKLLTTDFEKGKFSATIFNTTGRKLFSIELKKQITEIDLSNYPSGVYFIELKGEKKLTTKKLIKL